MQFSLTDDSDQMYLSYSVKIVDEEGTVLGTLNCRHERQWTVAGFCRAGLGLARCVDCGVYFHGGTWASVPMCAVPVRRVEVPKVATSTLCFPTVTTTRTIASRAEPAIGSARGKYGRGRMGQPALPGQLPRLQC